MSTPSKTSNPQYEFEVMRGVVENAVFSAFYNLVECRKTEGVTKSSIAERMGVDRATITKLTSVPTNMKVSTMSYLASSLDADIVFLLVDKANISRVFSSIGTHIVHPISSQKNPIFVIDGSKSAHDGGRIETHPTLGNSVLFMKQGNFLG